MRCFLPIFIFSLVILVSQQTSVEGKKTKPTAVVQEIPTSANKAAAEGDMDTLESILKKDANAVHRKDSNGWQPMHESARAGHVDVINLLVTKYGAGVNERTVHRGKPGGTPLHYAQRKFGADHPVVATLKKLGAVNVSPELQQTTDQILEESHPVHDAAAQGDIGALKEILKKDAKAVHKKDKNGWQAIHEAARAGHADIASMLIQKHGVDVNERTLHEGKKGGTPLYFAERRNGADHAIVATLKKLGAINLGPEL